MRVGEGFSFNGLNFNNSMEHITLCKIEIGLDKFYESNNKQIEECYQNLKNIINIIATKIKVVEIEAGSFEKNFPSVVFLLCSKNDFRLDCVRFGQYQRALLKLISKKVGIETIKII